MNLIELQNQIKSNQLNNIYVFTGDEIAVQKIYINKIAQTSNLEIQYVDNLKSIYNKLNINDMFNSKKLYIIIDDIDFIKEEKLWNNINTNNNIIIFKFNNLDKRSKFYKQFENKIVEFNKLSNEILIKYIKKEINMSNENCESLIKICNNSYNQILLEVDKIVQYGKTQMVDTPYDFIFNILNNSGVFHKEISDITFEFIEKVLKRQYNNIFDLRKKLIQIGESNIKLLSLLYTNFKTVLLIQSCNSNDICKTTGLQYYQVKYNQDKLNYYSIGELVNALKIIQKTEEGIKTGKIDEDISIDYVLCNIL